MPPLTPPSRRRRLAFGILTLVTIVVVPFALMEALVRITRVGSPYPFKIYNDIVVKGRPHARFVHRAEGVHRVRYNNWGFHDRLRDDSSRGSRVLVLGDSFVEAREVNVDRMFTALVERDFSHSGTPVEIINAGFAGTGTAYQYVLWREYFRWRLDIDQLVLCVYLGNDLEDNGLHLGSRQLVYVPYVDADGSIDVVRDPSARRKVFAWARRQSALLNTMSRGYAMLWRLIERRTSQEASGEDLGTMNSPAAWGETITGTMHLLERWAEELEARGTRLSIAVINPPTYYRTGRYRNHHYVDFKTKLGQFARRADVPLLEIDFSRYRPEEIYSRDGVTLGHLNERGHRVAGEQMFKWLAETRRF